MGLKTIFSTNLGNDNGRSWQNFAKEVKGNYSTPYGEDMVDFYIKNYKVVFDNHTHHIVLDTGTSEREYSRGIVEFVSPDNLKMRILPQDLIETIGKFFGAQDITIGNKAFDRKFMIKGNNESQIKFLLDGIIRDFLLRQKIVRFEITDGEGIFDEKPKEGHYMIYYLSETKINDEDQLRELYNFFDELIRKVAEPNRLNYKTSS